MYLFILESIGTSELILIAVVALIVFGPRKLPQMVKTIGKTMAEFRGATNEFKATWAREAAFEDEIPPRKEINPAAVPAMDEKTIGRSSSPILSDAAVLTPQIRELTSDDVARAFPNKEIQKKEESENKVAAEPSGAGKRDWL